MSNSCQSNTRKKYHIVLEKTVGLLPSRIKLEPSQAILAWYKPNPIKLDLVSNYKILAKLGFLNLHTLKKFYCNAPIQSGK